MRLGGGVFFLFNHWNPRWNISTGLSCSNNCFTFSAHWNVLSRSQTPAVPAWGGMEERGEHVWNLQLISDWRSCSLPCFLVQQKFQILLSWNFFGVLRLARVVPESFWAERWLVSASLVRCVSVCCGREAFCPHLLLRTLPTARAESFGDVVALRGEA